MNNVKESVSALRNLWGCTVGKIKQINYKYLILPVTYVLVILMVVPSTKIMYSNNIHYESLDTYKNVTITTEDKIDYILKTYKLNKNEFNVLSAIVLSEAQGGSYEDAYAVINTIYNRTHSKNWVRSVNGHFGINKGKSLYYQAISPGQFTVYKSGSYKRHLNETKSVGFKAIVDFLYTENTMHNYLSFRSHSIKIKNSESFSSKGNNYFNVLKEENRI